MNQSIENQVKFIRLLTGEDIVTEIKRDEKTDEYILIRPLKIIYVFGDKPGIISIGLVQWIFPEIVESQEISVKANDILAMTTPSIQLEANYWESLDSLEKSQSFDFSGRNKSVQANNLDNFDLKDYNMETSSDEAEIMKESLQTLKKTYKRKLH